MKIGREEVVVVANGRFLALSSVSKTKLSISVTKTCEHDQAGLLSNRRFFSSHLE